MYQTENERIDTEIKNAKASKFYTICNPVQYNSVINIQRIYNSKTMKLQRYEKIEILQKFIQFNSTVIEKQI